MSKLPRWLESVIAEAETNSVAMPYARGNRTPKSKREQEPPKDEPLRRSA